MQLPGHPGNHLTYCSNVHFGESWDEIFVQLKQYLPDLKQRLSPGNPFGIGLRLSARAAQELLKPGELEQFDGWMKQQGLYLFAINGFPYGNFHGKRVKDEVYAPDWSTKERVDYTSGLIEILSALLPEGMDGGISTSPVTYKYWFDETEDSVEETVHKSCEHFAELAYKMALIREETGKELHLDIEPEPDCYLETSRETITFFTKRLFPEGSTFLVKKYGVGEKEAEQMLRTHIGVCYDACHFAVEFENPVRAIQSFRTAGIRIGRMQISAALKAEPGRDPLEKEKVLQQLGQFDEPVYLHQVVERRKNGTLVQYRDLSHALSNEENMDAEEWRIHFHVPIFVGEFGSLKSTQDDITEGLPELLNDSLCRHFEIETYTWDVLPGHLKSDLAASIEREFRWVLEQAEKA